MISVQQADELIAGCSVAPTVVEQPCSQPTPAFLAENLCADRDFPPFDRVAMDGIALAYEQWVAGHRRFAIQGVQAAGDPCGQLGDDAVCLEVMTGAMLPKGADLVVPYERLERHDQTMSVGDEELKRWQNVHRQGSDRRRGDVIVSAGAFMAAPEWAIAATVGKARLQVYRPPRVAVVTTGAELVAVDATPQPHQIRASNDIAITSALRAQHIFEVQRFRCADDHRQTRELVLHLLDGYDVLIFSGGVSMGKYDLMPDVFAEVGIEAVFHKVKQRPGKPLYYGLSSKKQQVFGLPGNPISALISFYRFVVPALQKRWAPGEPQVGPLFVRLQNEIQFAKPLTLFRPVRLNPQPTGELWAEGRKTNGSGDLAGLCQTDGFVELPAEKAEFAVGEAVRFWSWQGHFMRHERKL
jgi:molybdopterin molybdotransferase